MSSNISINTWRKGFTLMANRDPIKRRATAVTVFTHPLLLSLNSILFELFLQTATSLQANLFLVLHLQQWFLIGCSERKETGLIPGSEVTAEFV